MRKCQKYWWCAITGALVLLISGCNLFGAPTGVKPEGPGASVKPHTPTGPPKQETGDESAAPVGGPADNKTGPAPAQPEKTPPEKSTSGKAQSAPRSRKAAYTPVDISSAFNASATGGADGLDGWGNAYPADELPRDKKTALGAVAFDLPDYTRAGKNVVDAKGQTVRVAHGSYSALHVLAVATNGAQEEKLILAYGDEKSAAELKISDWCDKPAFGEAQVASFARVSGDNEGAQCKLYMQTIAVDPAKKLSSITLPTNSDIHIFAMTLAK